MAESETEAHHRALAAFVTEHRDQIEQYADSDKETAELAAAVLGWDRADARTAGGVDE
ncbi:hypothetical protein HALDL1_16595 [Halobacterium sp. DL1]|jgi:hypothetical protein|nr:hypothetical protein HALDL1_16595 [Halobacterium sp. DL1]